MKLSVIVGTLTLLAVISNVIALYFNITKQTKKALIAWNFTASVLWIILALKNLGL
jgi:hypothetical protein